MQAGDCYIHTFPSRSLRDLEPKRYSAALHRYAPLLFVLPAVEVSDLPGHPCGYDVVRCEKRIHHGSLPVVDMADCRYVAHVDSLCGGHCEDQKMGRDG